MSKKEFVIPLEVEAQFGVPPLLRGEDDSAYYTLMDNFAKLVEPKDLMEWWWVKDMTDHTWEIRRLRRLKVVLPECYDGTLRANIERPAKSQDEAVDREKEAAHLLSGIIRDYTAVDKLIASAELRRDRTLREIERRRETLARRLRKASEEVVRGKIVKLDEAA